MHYAGPVRPIYKYSGNSGRGPVPQPTLLGFSADTGNIKHFVVLAQCLFFLQKQKQNKIGMEAIWKTQWPWLIVIISDPYKEIQLLYSPFSLLLCPSKSRSMRRFTQKACQKIKLLPDVMLSVFQHNSLSCFHCSCSRNNSTLSSDFRMKPLLIKPLFETITNRPDQAKGYKKLYFSVVSYNHNLSLSVAKPSTFRGRTCTPVSA